jgi:predicted alpha/beta superfamily hydrolase
VKGTLHTFSLEERFCACFVPQGEGPFPLAVLCGWGLEEKLAAYAQDLPPTLLFFARADGDRDFTPWPAPGIREGEEFFGEAGDYLTFLTQTALPYLEKEFGASTRPEERGILGYSLGGLFALWAQRQGEFFRLAGSLSGSLWYPGWLDYLEQHPPRPEEKIYLSLGDREEYGGPPLLRTVGDCTRRAYALYKSSGAETLLEWNRGGHGKAVDSRWIKALTWALPRLREE